MFPLSLTDNEVQNLIKLESYLRKGILKADFTMSKYTEEKAAYQKDQEYCGTVGCAVGHGPYAGIPKRIGEGWQEYSYRCFVPKWIGTTSPFWMWLFDPFWASIDNTPLGAAQRIRYLLDNKRPPKKWNPSDVESWKRSVEIYQKYEGKR